MFYTETGLCHPGLVPGSIECKSTLLKRIVSGVCAEIVCMMGFPVHSFRMPENDIKLEVMELKKVFFDFKLSI